MEFDINNFPEGVNVTVRYIDAMDWVMDKQVKGDLPLYYTGYYRCFDLSEVDMTQVTNISAIDESNLFYWPPDKKDVVINMPKVQNLTTFKLLYNSSFYPSDNSLTFNLDSCTTMTYLMADSVILDKLIINGNATPTNITYPGGYQLQCEELHINLDCSALTTLRLTASSYWSDITYFSGLPNQKISLTSYGIDRMRYLSYESCISVMESLYDFTGNGQTPTSSQGKLKVHANFLTTVGDEISIATSRGWTITT